MKSLFLAASFFLASLFGNHPTAIAVPVVPSAAAVATINSPASTAPAVPQTLPLASTAPSAASSALTVTRTPAATEGLVLGTSTQANYVTQDELTAQINDLRSLIAQLLATTTAYIPEYIAAGGNPANPYAADSAIDNISDATISGGTISNVTLSGVSGLSTSDLGDFSYATSTDFQHIAAWGDSLTSYTSDLSVLAGVYVYDGREVGDTSSQIAARMLAATSMYSWPTIIWSGRNSITGNISSDEPYIDSYIASMVAALKSVGNDNYIILSIVNNNTEPSGSTDYNELIQINNDLATTYGSHYLDVRTYLVQDGLSAAGITPSAQDLTDISNDIPPTDLRSDYEHYNSTGLEVIAEYIYAHIGLLLSTPASPPILTTTNFTSYLTDPPSFGQLDTQNGYMQNGTTILTTTFGTAVGYQALQEATTSNNDTAIGQWALQEDTSGAANTAVGVGALQYDATSSNNTAVGYSALIHNQGASNSAFGLSALYLNTYGAGNSAFGVNALEQNTTGTDNTALSRYGLYVNTTGSFNTAIGSFAEQFNTSATSTVAIGYNAANGVEGDYYNQGTVAVGYQAGYDFETSADYNTLVGYQAGEIITTGYDNTILGASPNAGGTHVKTGSNDILIGFNANTPSTTQSNFLNIGGVLFGTLPATSSSSTFSVPTTGAIAIGTTTPYARLSVWGADSASSTLAFNVVNHASSTVFAVFDGGNAQLSGTLTQSSDQRLKTDIQSLDASSSLSLIDALNPVTFNWIDPTKGTTPQLGFIAQQVQQVFPDLIATTSATALTPNGTLGLNYIGLISPIVSAIQALYGDVQSLEQTVAGFATIFHTQELCVGSTCVTPAQFQAMVAASNEQSGDAGALDSSVSGTSTPPTITINGDDPATIDVGSDYSDLGATAVDADGHSLDVETFLNGTESPTLTLDTTAPATDTIEYVATDTSGNTATSTRTVVIEGTTAASSTTQ